LHWGGPAELCRYLARLAVLTGVLTMAMVTLICIAPGYVVHLLYGQQYEGIDELVRWLCAPLAVYAISTVLVIWAAAIEQTQVIFVSYVVATAFTILAAYPLTLYGGLAGIVLGTLLVEFIRVGSLLIPLLRWRRAINASS
jgi:O-antigen/teichoic acid export membrane protein